jgi:hypothetical protein
MAGKLGGCLGVSFLLIRRLQSGGRECDAHWGVAAFL